jgi:hypothetical protein
MSTREGDAKQKRKIEGVGTCSIQTDGLVFEEEREIRLHHRHR